MRDNAARLSDYLLLRCQGRLRCTPVVYVEGNALRARPRRQPSSRRLIRLRWRWMGRMDVLFPATAAAAITIAAAAAAAAATLAALATLNTTAAAFTALATLAAALATFAALAALIT